MGNGVSCVPQGHQFFTRRIGTTDNNNSTRDVVDLLDRVALLEEQSDTQERYIKTLKVMASRQEVRMKEGKMRILCIAEKLKRHETENESKRKLQEETMQVMGNILQALQKRMDEHNFIMRALLRDSSAPVLDKKNDEARLAKLLEHGIEDGMGCLRKLEEMSPPAVVQAASTSQYLDEKRQAIDGIRKRCL
ncbi:uncharacterized protein LOC116615379 [Nematostella vectensis]|uniref:uncharacterized protein LOC116615379 n=1 Tax=Nematostella vectensis TaxID=45351 RepID=UPI002077579D|nr:uncharacterized protein LOC116615379 [Nematostella vectensis]